MTRPILSTRTTIAGLALLALASLSTARAQDWLLDDSLKAFSTDSLNALKDGVAKAPERALNDILKEETKNAEALTDKELEAFGKEAWTRLCKDAPDGHLARAIRPGPVRQDVDHGLGGPLALVEVV